MPMYSVEVENGKSPYESLTDCGKYCGCYKFTFEGREEKGWFFLKNGAYDVCLLRDEGEERGPRMLNLLQLEHIPYLYLDRRTKIRLGLDTELVGIYVVHIDFFEYRKLSFRKGYADIYGIQYCRERQQSDVMINQSLFPVHFYDDSKPVVNCKLDCNVNSMYEQYCFRDQVAQQFTRHLLKTEFIKEVNFDVSQF